ncbi:MAG: PaaI family thioesterase [Spirochaetaceae bacterium]|nr:PaaI family thioesterase [Spirochaetaceae bacterium]
MKKIINPFVNNKNYSCFGCSPDNPGGLQMEFFEEGDDVVCLWEPRDKFTGYGHILHGGVQATLMDEIASWVVFVKLKTAGFTTNINVDYKNQVLINKGNIIVRASLKEMKKNIAHVSVTLSDGEGKLGSEGIVQYFTLPEKIAVKKMAYPGIEGFYE